MDTGYGYRYLFATFLLPFGNLLATARPLLATSTKQKPGAGPGSGSVAFWCVVLHHPTGALPSIGNVVAALRCRRSKGRRQCHSADHSVCHVLRLGRPGKWHGAVGMPCPARTSRAPLPRCSARQAWSLRAARWPGHPWALELVQAMVVVVLAPVLSRPNQPLRPTFFLPTRSRR